jgi:hypothetical protein
VSLLEVDEVVSGGAGVKKTQRRPACALSGDQHKHFAIYDGIRAVVAVDGFQGVEKREGLERAHY